MLTVDLRAAECIKRLTGVDYPMMAEIGCWRGEMSKRVLYRQGLHLLMVDPWGANKPSQDYLATGDDKAEMTEEQWRAAKDAATRNVAWAGSRATMYQGTSASAAHDTAESGQMFDLVFIDGDHSYSGCNADIQAWWLLIASGGWLGGHDYRDDLPYGVIQAVQEFAEREEIDIHLGENHTWWARKP